MSIYDEIREERVRQYFKWGGLENDDKNSSNDWLAYIVKHAGRGVMRPWDLGLFRRQMIRVAALAVAAIEWCDRRAKRIV